MVSRIINPATAISLDKSSISLSAVGQTEKLTATVTPPDTTSKITRSSSDTSIATVTPYTPRLPSEYQEVEYIQGTGAQYLNVGSISTLNLKSELKVNSQMISESAIFGSSWALNGNFLMFYNNAIRWHSASAVDVSCSTDTDYVIKTENGKLTVNGTDYTCTASTSVAGNPITIYKAYNSSATYGRFKLYYIKFWQGTTLVRDLVPCYRKSDGEIGMYDLVNDTFYTNSGSGTFTKGADVSADVIVTCVTPGECTITATTDNGLTATCGVSQGWTPGANTLWYLNLNQSDAVFTDAMGHTVNNNGITYSSSGVSEGCGYNNTSGKRLYSTFGSGESFPASLTIMGFIKPSGSHYTNDHPMGITLANATTKVTLGIGFNQSNSQVQFNYLKENIAWTTSSATPTSGAILNTWHHYALTYDGSTMKGYIDGELKINTNISGSGSGTGPNGGLTVFGRNHPNYTNTIQGYVDEAICEDKVWTAQEIQDYLDNYTY